MNTLIVNNFDNHSRLRRIRVAVVLDAVIALDADCYPKAADQLVRHRPHHLRAGFDLDRHRHGTLRSIKARNISLVRRTALKEADHTLKIKRPVRILDGRIIKIDRLPRLIVAIGETPDFALTNRINNPQRLRRIQRIRSFIRR